MREDFIKTELLTALRNQGNSADEAIEIMEEMIESVNQGNDPEDLLDDHGLEPDYVFDILNLCI